MKHIWKHLRGYEKESIIAPLFKLLEASFELIVPLVMASIIDRGILSQDGIHIGKMCFVLVALAAVGLVCSVLAQYFSAKVAVGFGTKLRHALFKHIEGLSFSEIDSVGTTTLITRMTSDVNQLQTGVNMVLRLFLRSPFIVFGAMIMAFTVDVKSAMVFVVAIPLLSIVVFGVMIASIPLFKKVQNSLDAIMGITRENLSGVRVIRAFNKENDEIASFEDKNSLLYRMQLLVGKVSAMMNPLTYIIINVATLILVWLGAHEVFAGNLTKGEVVALVNYMSQILVELVKLTNLIILITKSVACGKRIETVFQINQGMKTEQGLSMSGKSHEYLEFSNVFMSYQDAGKDALSDIDFTVKKGETVGIIGGTGAGKSTLVHLIPRFYDVSQGGIYLEGKDLREYDLVELRDKVGIVMQNAVLFKGTIRENMKWGKPDCTDEEINRALEIAQALEIVNKKENGLDHEIEQGGKNLSGGQRQRLTIARAIVKKPEILILDDSASALDFATDAKLRQALKQLQEQGDTTIFIVSQRTSSLQSANRIIVLDNGRIVGNDTHENLLLNCSVYQEIYDSQFKKIKKEEGCHE